MIKRKVVEIHLICREGLNVVDLGNEHFRSGYWKISERHAKTALYICLHESKNKTSYRQGLIENWERSEERPERIIFYAKAMNNPMEWVGNGAGEKGYRWE